MKLSWRTIRDHYRNACGSATQAVAEEWAHLNAGLQFVCDQVDVRELLASERVTCFTGRDWVPLPADCYAVYAVNEITGKYRLDPEPAGMRGRLRYLSTDGIPSSGQPRFYAMAGEKLYLRDTPNADDTLLVHFKRQPVAVSEADLEDFPIVPQQHHWAIVYYAAGNYYSLHPDADDAPEGRMPRGAMLHQKAMGGIANPPEQRAKEDLDRRQYTRLAGYDMNVRGR